MLTSQGKVHATKGELTKSKPEKDGACLLCGTPARQSIGEAVTKSFGMGVVLGVFTASLGPS
jgi:hypothetical protein